MAGRGTLEHFLELGRRRLDSLAANLLRLARDPAAIEREPEVLDEVLADTQALSGLASSLGLDRIHALVRRAVEVIGRVRARRDAVGPSWLPVLLSALDALPALLGEPPEGRSDQLPLQPYLEALDRLLAGGGPAADAPGPAGPVHPASGPRQPLLNLKHRDEFLRTFLADTTERIENLIAGLLRMRDADCPRESLEELFRTAHRIKGSAALMGFSGVAAWTHRIEEALEGLLDGWMTRSPSLTQVLLRAAGELQEVVRAIEAGTDAPGPAVGAGAARDAGGAPSSGAREPAPADAAEAPSGKEGGETIAVEVVRLARLETLSAELALHPARCSRILESLRGAIAGASALPPPPGLQEALAELDREAERLETVRGLVAALDEAVSWVGRASEELRRSVLEIRLLPVETLFRCFPRMVEELAASLGKQVGLETRGGGIEVDRHTLEGLLDPLTHLLRNALDHGVETPEERRAAEKPPRGRLVLSASCEAGDLCISVEDDGRGIDVARVSRRAQERGLRRAGEEGGLDLEGAIEMIFRPGFSTVGAVSEVSGRGIGLHVVKVQIGRLRGEIEVESRPGGGTRFSMRLPRAAFRPGAAAPRGSGGGGEAGGRKPCA